MSTVAAFHPGLQVLALPTTFLGDAAAVALAFCLPALLAGLWVGAQGLYRRLGGRTLALVAGSLTVLLGFTLSTQGPGTPTDITSLVRSVMTP
jgi:hypothetical protein